MEWKKLITLSIKSVHFILNNEVCVQNDVVAIGISLESDLPDKFFVELEERSTPRLDQHVKIWRHYVDDTFQENKNESADYAKQSELKKKKKISKKIKLP